jgi:hypothetical protein
MGVAIAAKIGDTEQNDISMYVSAHFVLHTLRFFILWFTFALIFLP